MSGAKRPSPCWLKPMKLYDPITEFAEALEAVEWYQFGKKIEPYTDEEIEAMRVVPKEMRCVDILK